MNRPVDAVDRCNVTLHYRLCDVDKLILLGMTPVYLIMLADGLIDTRCPISELLTGPHDRSTVLARPAVARA